MEQHCLLFRRSVFDRIGSYDGELNTRDEIDLSLSLYKAGVPVVYEPACEVHYLPPYPPRDDETEYFFMKWDLDRAERSRARIQEKWNLVAVPGDMGFVRDRNLIGTLSRVKQELSHLIAPEESLILVDQNQWLCSDIVAGLRVIPFLEHEGQYWGLPEDDATAIREFERLWKAGASLIVFSWASTWWFDYYKDFYAHLTSRFECVLENDRLTVFDLRKEAASDRHSQSAA
jgi:hypothetical protein